LGVVLAGGAGRRIGGRKAFVELAGRPLIAHVVDRLSPQVSGLAINAEPDPGFEPFGLTILQDPMPGLGPLAGILSALDWAAECGADRVVTVAVDTPFLPQDLVQRLMAAADGPSFAATPDGPHGTTGAWPVACRDELDAALNAGTRKVLDWTASIGAQAVVFEDSAAFLNINTADDLRQAGARFGA